MSAKGVGPFGTSFLLKSSVILCLVFLLFAQRNWWMKFIKEGYFFEIMMPQVPQICFDEAYLLLPQLFL